MKLQTKFTLISAVVVSLVMTAAVINYRASHKTEKALITANRIAEVIQRHMDGDMMHDAIRADVLAALHAHVTGNLAGISQADKDIDEHATQFNQDFEENLKSDTPAEIHQTYQEAMPNLAAYTAEAKKVITTLRAGGDPQTAQADFLTRFSAMEESNEALTEELQKWNDAEESKSKHMVANTQNIMGILSIINVLSIILLPILTTFLIFRPLRKNLNVMSDLAKGQYDMTIEGTERSDEMGEISRAIDLFKQSGIERVKLEKEQEAARARQQEETERQSRRSTLTDGFAKRMQAIIENVAAAATEMYHTAESMGYTISSASTRVNNVATASASTATNVQSVAAAAEEMSSTVREIAEQIARSTTNVRNVVTEVGRADQTAVQLDEAAHKIGQIVDVIQTIAEQINLLALNATIESARAGEAGKGFAVVAGEVKALATQTSKATDEIAANIGSIQDVSKQVLAALQSIKGAISGVEEISAAISAAVEEQNAATNEIAGNMGTAAASTGKINEEIKVASTATSDSANSANEVLEAAKMLSQEAEKLSKEVSEFISDMAA